MSYPEKYDEKLKYWNLSTLPFIPEEFKYEVITAVEKQFDIVSHILNREDVDTIYVCTDSGREGEYIYRLVDNMSGKPAKEKRRVWIDSQTEEAILNGMKEAKELSCYDSLSSAAYLRAKEDYLIGINFSRLLSLVYGKELARKLKEEKAVISIGRVMTCVLGMIVKREREIRNFKKVNFYKIQAQFGDNVDNSFTGEWKSTKDSMFFESPKLYNESGFKEKKTAEAFIAYVKEIKDTPVIKEMSKKTQKEKPPMLFNLAELQNECSKRFKISPDETLEVVQSLYEKKMVTYPRTDARVLSTAVAKEITKNLNGLAKSPLEEDVKQHIKKMITEKYSTKLEKTKYVNDSKITDHYAIIPTGQGFENYTKITLLEKEIYHLIVKRFLSIFYPAAEYNKVAITVGVGKEEFFATGKVCVKSGYLDVMKQDKKLDLAYIKSNGKTQSTPVEEKEGEEKEEIKESSMDILAKLKKGQLVEVLSYHIKEGETSPPSRYSSGSIILAMENAGKLIEDEALREQIKGSGIGTSATRAEIIKKLERICYISSNKKTQILTPTEKGEAIYDIVLKTIPDMLNPELTASWEKGLTMVAENEIAEDAFMTKLENYIRSKVVKFKKARNEYLYGM